MLQHVACNMHAWRHSCPIQLIMTVSLSSALARLVCGLLVAVTSFRAGQVGVWFLTADDVQAFRYIAAAVRTGRVHI